MNNPLVVCALKDEFSIKGSNYDLLYTGVGKVNATIHLTEYLLKKEDQNTSLIMVQPVQKK